MLCLICRKAKLSSQEKSLGIEDDEICDVCEPCRADAALGRDAEAELSRLRAENVAKDAEIERIKGLSRHPDDIIMLNQQQTKIIEQKQIIAAKDAEIERLKAILADALEWGMTSKHFDAGRSLKNGEDARAAISRAEQAKPETETCAWRVEDGKRAVTSCYSAVYTWSQIATGPEICPDCGKRVEVRG